MGVCSKKEPTYPEEFVKQIAQLSKIREGTQQIVLQLEKMNTMEQINPLMKKKKQQTKKPNIIEQMALTCNKYNAIFSGHEYADQLNRFVAALRKIDHSKMDIQAQIEKECIAPMRQWSGDGYETFMKDLINCQKLKEEVRKLEASKKANQKEKDKAKKAYESQRAYCAKEMESTQKQFNNQMQYIRKIMELQYKGSMLAYVTLDGARMKNILVAAQSQI